MDCAAYILGWSLLLKYSMLLLIIVASIVGWILSIKKIFFLIKMNFSWEFTCISHPFCSTIIRYCNVIDRFVPQIINVFVRYGFLWKAIRWNVFCFWSRFCSTHRFQFFPIRPSRQNKFEICQHKNNRIDQVGTWTMFTLTFGRTNRLCFKSFLMAVSVTRLVVHNFAI